jgi:hypothetical protein
MASPENVPDVRAPGPARGPMAGPDAGSPPPFETQPNPIQPAAGPEFRRTWQGKLLSISFAVFAFEIGLCLVTFPWIDKTWDISYFQSASQAVRDFWNDPYFRGAVTGLGFINIYIAFLEVGRLFRRPSVR